MWKLGNKKILVTKGLVSLGYDLENVGVRCKKLLQVIQTPHMPIVTTTSTLETLMLACNNLKIEHCGHQNL
jgi:hypothetical protein